MEKIKWNDLTAGQKIKGIALIKEHEQFILKDDKGVEVVESDDQFIVRIAQEWLFELAIGLHRNKKGTEARNAAVSL